MENTSTPGASENTANQASGTPEPVSPMDLTQTTAALAKVRDEAAKARIENKRLSDMNSAFEAQKAETKAEADKIEAERKTAEETALLDKGKYKELLASKTIEHESLIAKLEAQTIALTAFEQAHTERFNAKLELITDPDLKAELAATKSLKLVEQILKSSQMLNSTPGQTKPGDMNKPIGLEGLTSMQLEEMAKTNPVGYAEIVRASLK